MGEEWRPLSARTGSNTSYDALHEGVPPWLVKSLQDWLWGRIAVGGYVNGNLLMEIERRVRAQLSWHPQGQDSAALHLRSLAVNDPDRFLDVIDFVLRGASPYSQESTPQELEQMLLEGGSAWRVVAGENIYMLQKRVPEAVAAAAQRAMSTAGKAGMLLMHAWNAAYGRSPNPTNAYQEAVRAVETIAQPIITAKDSTATLGKMISAFEAAPDKWECVLQPVRVSALEKVLGMMQLLWFSQHDRHGSADEDKPLHVGQEEAAAAVQLAVALVEFFNSAAVRLK